MTIFVISFRPNALLSVVDFCERTSVQLLRMPSAPLVRGYQTHTEYLLCIY